MAQDSVRELGYLCLGSRLKRIGERLQADVQRLATANDIDVQAGHYPLLAAINQQGALTVGELVTALGIKQPGVTRSIRHLEKQGYIEIVRGENDLRRKTVSLTASGKALVKKSQIAIWPCIESTLKELCDDQTGDLLELLDFVEDELTECSLERRVTRRLNKIRDDQYA